MLFWNYLAFSMIQRMLAILSLDEGERGECKADLKFNIKKAKILASSPTTSWWVEKVMLCSWTPKLLWMIVAAIEIKDASSCKESMRNMDNTFKSKDITLLTRVHLVKAVFFPNSWESLGQQEDQISQFIRKWTLNIHWENLCWSSNTLAIWGEDPTCRKRP